MDIPWDPGGVTRPTVATGCLIKLLNFNLESHALTFLYCMTPGFYQDNISYHDCAEESYHLWGTSWMMQFGDVPTGGYFWRPPISTTAPSPRSLVVSHWAAPTPSCSTISTTTPGPPPKENADRSAMRLALRVTHCFITGPWTSITTIPTASKISRRSCHGAAPTGRDEEPHKSDGNTHDHWHRDHHHHVHAHDDHDPLHDLDHGHHHHHHHEE